MAANMDFVIAKDWRMALPAMRFQEIGSFANAVCNNRRCSHLDLPAMENDFELKNSSNV
jgi:hypothetical protein